jgi:hypothetical protein
MTTALIKFSRLAALSPLALAFWAGEVHALSPIAIPDGGTNAGTYAAGQVYTFTGGTFTEDLAPDPTLTYIANPGNNVVATSDTSSETDYVNTPVSVSEQAYSTTVDALLNGQSVFSMTFALSATDPAFQAAVTQADNLLTADGASFSLPALASSLTTNSVATTDFQTNQSVTSGSSSVRLFGPGTLQGYIGVGTPATSLTDFFVNAGQTDVNIDDTLTTTIDRTVTTTNTDLLTQTYDIVGTPHAAPAVPEASDLALLALGLLPLGLIVRAKRRKMAA